MLLQQKETSFCAGPPWIPFKDPEVIPGPHLDNSFFNNIFYVSLRVAPPGQCSSLPARRVAQMQLLISGSIDWPLLGGPGGL